MSTYKYSHLLCNKKKKESKQTNKIATHWEKTAPSTMALGKLDVYSWKNYIRSLCAPCTIVISKFSKDFNLDPETLKFPEEITSST